MATLDTEIAIFDTLRSSLEVERMGDWVLIHEREFVGTFASFEEAAQLAVASFGRGPYLIRQVGAPPVVLPASVRYHPLLSQTPT
jgi:hypothetical protein